MSQEAEKQTPAVGEALKQTQNGSLPIGSVADILKKAPEDIVEEVIEIPEWGCSVRVRSFTAAQSARVRQLGIGFKGDSTQVAWAAMERAQFEEGVIEPQFKADEVRKLHLTSGKGFSRVIAWLDKHSGLDKEELAQAREEFQGPGE